MNHQNSTELIHEDELRAALFPMRPDAAGFSKAIQQTLAAATVSAAASEPAASEAHIPTRVSDWTCVAASVIPIPMYGQVSGVPAASSLANVSIGKKLIGIVALPAISLLLMIGGTLWCIWKVSRASKLAGANVADTQESWEAVGQWWKRYGWILVVVPVLHFGLMFVGVTIPLVLIFAVSSLAMVWLITELGRRGLIVRQYVIGGLINGLIVVAGLAQVTRIGGATVHLLDQGYVMAVLQSAIFILAAISVSSTVGVNFGRRRMTWLLSGALLIPLSLLFGFQFQSLWRPVTTDSLRQYVSGFTEAPYSTASWQQWVIPARWLKAQGVDVDMSGAQHLAAKEATDEANLTILNYASEFELLTTDELPLVEHYDHQLSQLFDEANRDKQIFHLSLSEYIVRRLLATGQLSPPQRDVLSGRLKETLRLELQNRYVTLGEVQSLLEFMMLIDRPADAEEFSTPILQLLVQMQRRKTGSFRPGGGFAAYPSSISGDDNATLAAIELMEDWGVPEQVDVMALRSFLRPSYQDRGLSATGNTKLFGLRAGGAFHFVGRQRLNNMATVPTLTAWDFLRYEQNLIMSILFSVLAIYSALAAPSQAKADKNKHGNGVPLA